MARAETIIAISLAGATRADAALWRLDR